MHKQLLRTTLLGALLSAALPLTAFAAPDAQGENTDLPPPAAALPKPDTEAQATPRDAPSAAAATSAAPDADVPAPPATPAGETAPVADSDAQALVDDALTRDVLSAQDVLKRRKHIASLESSEGAYASRLSESLLGLGLQLQAQGRHDEAVKVLRRGVHLARVNEGLYCTQQIPLLQAEITSHVAVKDYTAADERQSYLYRVQTRNTAGGQDLAAAYMQQAQWQRQAFELGIGQEVHMRLLQMADLYQLAMQDVLAREGDLSPNLLPPLYGMLQAQYLISGFDVPMPLPTFDEQPYVDQSILRFKSYRAQSYQQGNSIIQAIANINRSQPTADPDAIAQTLVLLGDWRLWNGKTDAAWEAYREAEKELANRGDAQSTELKLFGEPVALPAVGDLNPLPPMVAADAAGADIKLEFGVSERGRVQDIERLDTNEQEDRRAFQLMKRLRHTTFRPRFEAGQPVETVKLVKAFDLE